jgi:hypothetical protein
MLEYRAYSIGRNGQIIHCVDLVGSDDEAAKERVKQMVDRHWMELWHEGRDVRTREVSHLGGGRLLARGLAVPKFTISDVKQWNVQG